MTRRLYVVLGLAPWLLGFSPLTWLDPAAGENRAGNERYEAGQYEEAAKSYSKGNAADPGRPELLYNLGNALERLGKHDEASAAYHQALEKAPEKLSPDAWYNLGNSLLAQGQGKAAVQAYREALVRNPQHEGAKRNLELALEQAKKEPPPKNGQKGKDKDDKSDKHDRNDEQKSSEKSQDGQQSPKPSDSKPEPSSSPPKPPDEDQKVARNDGDEDKKDEAKQDQPPPPTEPKPENEAKDQSKAEEAEAKPSDGDLTRDQAEGLLRSFEQMERRQLQEAHPPKEPGETVGGRDW